MSHGELRRYGYLGPSGTFTERALIQVPEAQGQIWQAMNNVGEAFADLMTDRVDAAMFAVENSIEGGVAAVLDALTVLPDLHIVGEYIVPVQFAIVGRIGMSLHQVNTVAAHPVAYAQCAKWLAAKLPHHVHQQATSNMQSLTMLDTADAAIVPQHAPVDVTQHVLANNIADNAAAVTRFILVSKRTRFPMPAATGWDTTSLVADLPENRPGALLELLEQFATRGVNLSLLHSRPIGDALGRYRFVIDVEGHLEDEAVADALLGVRRWSPRIIFLGSYPRAQANASQSSTRPSNDTYAAARTWLDTLRQTAKV